MTALFLSIWFYIYAGLMFSTASIGLNLFPNTGCLTQVFFWPVLFVIYAFKQIRDSNFGWFVRYNIFKISHRND
jgi:hypothetical protein